MSHEAPDLRVVMERLDAVERQNRWMKMVGVAVLVLAGSAFLMGQAAPKSKVIEAEKLIIRDSEGKARAILGERGDRKFGLDLYDENEKRRASLYLRYGFGELLFLDKEEKSRAWFSSEQGVRFYDADNMVRIWLGTFADGKPSIQLSDEDGVKRAILGSFNQVFSSEGPDDSGIIKARWRERPASSLVLFDENRKIVWSAP